jgi:hypothetical protein
MYLNVDSLHPDTVVCGLELRRKDSKKLISLNNHPSRYRDVVNLETEEIMGSGQLMLPLRYSIFSSDSGSQLVGDSDITELFTETDHRLLNDAQVEY